MRDPLDVVRDRLAAKLGAIKAPDTSNPNVLRVTSQAVAAVEPARVGASRPTAARTGQVAMGGPERSTPLRALSPVPTAASGTTSSSTLAAAAGNARVHAVARRGASGNGHWAYEGADGPAHWAALSPDAAACAGGARQSPIDIRDGVKVDLDPVQFDYKPSSFSVVDTGHTVQVNVAPGNSIDVMGRHFELVQFHFHRPSEERIDGKPFDMVVHLVHKDATGRLAVVAVLLERGSAQPIVQSVWNNLPLEKGDELHARGTLDLSALLPADRRYYTYMGSLTTPPCSEDVLWMVMKTPVPVSDQQIGIFARLYPMNARPIQPASGRLIKESN